MKIFYGSFDVACEWTIKDAKGNELDKFSTELRQYVARDYAGATPRRADVKSAHRSTWMEFAVEEGLIVGVWGGGSEKLEISSAAPA